MLKMIVYWSPVWGGRANWNILYPEPERLATYIANQKAKNLPYVNLFRCPAYAEKTKNIFFVKNSLHLEVLVGPDRLIPTEKSKLGFRELHDPSLENSKLIAPDVGYVFYTEEDSLESLVTSPHFHKAKHLNYGSLVPGGFDMAKWFRNLAPEYNIWADSEKFVIEEDEPLIYIQFFTEKKITLKRFVMTEKLDQILQTTATSATWDKHKSLNQRYEMFRKSRTKEIILKEIKNNLV